jgi:hypothetical protein
VFAKLQIVLEPGLLYIFGPTTTVNFPQGFHYFSVPTFKFLLQMFGKLFKVEEPGLFVAL